MKYCYLCHDTIDISADGVISYSTSAKATDTLYACKQCVNTHGIDQTFDMLEESYEERASLSDTLPKINREALNKSLEMARNTKKPVD